MLKHVAIVGVGLIGTSFALAAKRDLTPESAPRIIGVDLDVQYVEQARQRGAIDAAGTFEQAASADLVLLAVPVRQMPQVLAALKPHLAEHTVIIDAGSTKQDVIAAARLRLGDRFRQFVACHPIAGRERHGPLAADTTLFDGKNVVLCRSPENSDTTVETARLAWQAVGAKVIEMTAVTHDAVFAAVSHLPHILAFALVEALAARPNAKLLFEHAASGFRDFTRIASSSPEMWRDVALNNREALLTELDAYLRRVAAVRDMLQASDGDAIYEIMQRAQRAREHWLSGQLDQLDQRNQFNQEDGL
ncbi:prephenate dehydrogenase [Betaproteobacteria bacterium UKL13-2]|nr:prephenate dehydrogenase [Betaproteobacteria bacterium UKL13-2]HCG52208.1 prephenate dehydrogenase/arogenate dehydrogenase family protein [Betaproteobacteria bacterium]